MEAPRDENYVPSKLACLNTDTVQGQNLVRLKINPITGGLKVTENSSINFTMKSIDPRDENYVNCWLFKGSDGLVYPAVANASGELLINNI